MREVRIRLGLVRRYLGPGITIRNDLFKRYKSNEDFIQKYIFPGGFLPSTDYIRKLAKKNQLHLEKLNFYSEDYAKTLFTWKNNFFTHNIPLNTYIFSKKYNLP